MKSQFLLISLFSVILCSQPFLRKLEDTVTEASCESEGKKFQEAVSATCKVSNYVFEVKKEEDCKSGTWDDAEGCVDALEIEKKEDCTGTPTFTEKGNTPATCTLNGVSINLDTMSEDNCRNAVKWNEAHCSDTTYKSSSDCTASKGTWKEAHCSDTTYKNSSDCTASKGTWEEAHCPNGSTDHTKCDGRWIEASCTDPVYTGGSDCTGVGGTWNENDSSCTNSTFTESSQCTSLNGNWSAAHCSDGTTDKNNCKDTWIEASCTGTTETNLDTSEKCNAPRGTWNEASCTGTTDTTLDSSDKCNAPRGTWYEASCSVPQFKTQEKCTGTPTYTPAQTTGECKSGEIVLSSRTTKATCEVALTWGNVKVCSYKQLKTEAACKSKADFTEGTPAKCVESSSNFLKTATFVFFIICLLF